MTLSVLEAFSSAMFRICGASRGPSASSYQKLSCVRQAVKEFVEVLVRDQSALGARPLLPATPSSTALSSSGVPLDATVQRHLSHFSLVTHGFGAPAIVAAMSAVQNYLSELLKCVDHRSSAPELSHFTTKH